MNANLILRSLYCFRVSSRTSLRKSLRSSSLAGRSAATNVVRPSFTSCPNQYRSRLVHAQLVDAYVLVSDDHHLGARHAHDAEKQHRQNVQIPALHDSLSSQQFDVPERSRRFLATSLRSVVILPQDTVFLDFNRDNASSFSCRQSSRVLGVSLGHSPSPIPPG